MKFVLLLTALLTFNMTAQADSDAPELRDVLSASGYSKCENEAVVTESLFGYGGAESDDDGIALCQVSCGSQIVHLYCSTGFYSGISYISSSGAPGSWTPVKAH